MNNKDYVLDSNIVSAVLNGHPKLRERLTIVSAERIFLNLVSAFENLRGWFAQVNKQQQIDRIVWAFDGLQQTLAYYVRCAQPQTGAALVFGGKVKYYRLMML
jgi:predicted nucleic acid-binding protein